MLKTAPVAAGTVLIDVTHKPYKGICDTSKTNTV